MKLLSKIETVTIVYKSYNETLLRLCFLFLLQCTVLFFSSLYHVNRAKESRTDTEEHSHDLMLSSYREVNSLSKVQQFTKFLSTLSFGLLFFFFFLLFSVIKELDVPTFIAPNGGISNSLTGWLIFVTDVFFKKKLPSSDDRVTIVTFIQTRRDFSSGI